MTQQDEALKVLATCRRKLADRLSDLVLANREPLLESSCEDGSPFQCSTELDHTAQGLVRLAHAITALESEQPTVTNNRPVDADKETETRDTIFDKFSGLISKGRLEEASHELSRVIHMPLDRASTATRFYARTVQAHPEIADDLDQLCNQVRTSPTSQCIRLLVTTFGLQAVESQMTIKALRERAETPNVP